MLGGVPFFLGCRVEWPVWLGSCSWFPRVSGHWRVWLGRCVSARVSGCLQGGRSDPGLEPNIYLAHDPAVRKKCVQ
eukprot:5136873-Amphidinium_carterae.1